MADEMTNKSDEMTRRASELASEKGDQAARTMSETGEQMAEQSRSAGQKVAEMARSTGERIAEASSATGQRLAQATEQAKDFVSSKVGEAGERIRGLREVDYGQMYEGVKSQIRMYPTESLLISAAIGFGLGLLLRRGGNQGM